MMIVILALLLPIAMATVFLITRHAYRRPDLRAELSAVSRQHIELFQGGHLSEAAVEAVKTRFRELLERGEVEAVEASLRAGMQYVVQVRALAELGTDDAGRILERQLQRRLTEDQIEQSWYWIDLANGLRTLNRSQSLPHLLHCAEAAGDSPLGHFLAAETVCFLSFSGFLRQHSSPLGRAAMRVLLRALEGLRLGVPPVVVMEGRLGEMVEILWDHRPETLNPLAVRIFHEALRIYWRAPHLESLLMGDGSEQEAFGWQISRLAALEQVMLDYLGDAPAVLCEEMRLVPVSEHPDWLLALIDLRAQNTSVLLPLLDQPAYPHKDLLLEALAWSKHQEVGVVLRQWGLERIPILRRSQSRRRATPPRRPSLPASIPYQSLLHALRGHPSRATEDFLLLAARDWDPTFRAVAVSSLGWWDPVQRAEVLLTLQDARRDPCPDVRQAARVALARLGERQALQWFRQTLTSEDPARVHDTIQLVASEDLTLLLPDLDRLADAEDIEIAHQAREALERLYENMDYRR